MENPIQLYDLEFDLFISENRIKEKVREMADAIHAAMGMDELHIVSALTGSFIFTADLVRELKMPCHIHFVKVSSYHGSTQSSGQIHSDSPLKADLKGKRVLIIEDIVDTGLTANYLLHKIKESGASDIRIATLLFKPDAYKEKAAIDFIGFSIPNAFVVGYGLDYKEIGRNLRAIYKLKKQEKSMLNVVLFGPPGAGKGTQAVKVAEAFQLVHLSTGDVFRYNIKNGTELGELAKTYIDAGKLVPDEVTVNMLKGEMEKNKDANGFIFDGFPRTIPQAEALDALLKDYNAKINGIVSLEVNEEELIARLKNRALTSGRTDDADENIIKNRIQVYKNETFPLKEYYEDRGIVEVINGIGTIEHIFSDICAAISKLK